MERGIAVVTLLVVFATVPGAVTGAANAASPVENCERGTIEVDYHVAHADGDQQSLEIRATIDSALDLRDCRVFVHDEATVTATKGLEQLSTGKYEWTGGQAEITYQVDVADEHVYASGDGWQAFKFVTYGIYVHDGTVRETDTVTVDRYQFVGTDGAATREMMFLGAHESFVHESDRGTVEVVVPDGVTLASDGDEVVDTLGEVHAAHDFGTENETFRYGADHDTLVFVVRPENSWTPRTGEPVSLVHSGAAIDAGDNEWFYEYVQTQQLYTAVRPVHWLEETSGRYYARLFAYQRGAADFDEFRRSVGTSGSRQPNLLGPDSWLDSRLRGTAVVAALDGRIRQATDGKRGFVDVVRLMNQRTRQAPTEQVDADAFVDSVVRVGGPSLDGEVRPLLTGERRASVPDDPSLYATPPSGGPLDSDGDGLANPAEVRNGTGLFDDDTDGDGLVDGRELELGADPHDGQSDNDALHDLQEAEIGTDPTNPDTDGDGLRDSREQFTGTDPTAADTDADGITDDAERSSETNATVADSDGDGVDDGRERDGGTNATVADTDDDGLDDGAEREHETDPTVVDTDGDGLRDNDEADDVTDPTVADSDGDGLDDGRERDLGTDPATETGFLTEIGARITGALGI